MKKMILTSSAFYHTGIIPAEFTADGKNISPPLNWENVPCGVGSFALLCTDPDVPEKTWLHWAIGNIPPTTRCLKQCLPPMSRLPNGAQQYKNDFGRLGYGGPNPPKGTHRYFFTLYALPATMDLPKECSLEKLQGLLDESSIGKAFLMGKYFRD